VDQNFTGKERDAESGLDYFGARYFSSAQGRFSGPDPIFIHPDRLTNPQRLNLYVYARNNPLRYVDPSGLDDITYDQAGSEIDRQKQSKWHNFWYGDTWKLHADNGQTFNLNAPLDKLSGGQRYSVVDATTTASLVSGFEQAHANTDSSSTVNLLQTVQLSRSGGQWDFKVSLNQQFGPHALFDLGGTAVASDYVGNLTWGFIMASYGYGEFGAHLGAGAQQVAHDAQRSMRSRSLKFEGTFGALGDDPRDFDAIRVGFGQYRSQHPLDMTPFQPYPGVTVR
jgi:RHS repeat-associated protein